MDNKLSELTYFMLERFSMNPVSSKIVGEEWRKTFPDEYAVAKVIRDLLTELEAKDKRIAELEAKTAMTMGVGSGDGNLFVHGDYDSIKTAQAIVLENETLRAKLATPVRLPNKNDEEFWFDGVFQIAKFDRAIERAIRAAGFIVSEE